MNLEDIQRFLGVSADGVMGKQTLMAIAKALGIEERSADPFQTALAEVLRHEGGWSNHSKDPGGMTNLGVTRATWEAWTKREASEADMRALTVEKVAPLYHQRYWQALRCDDLPAGLALCVFDFGVNAGPVRSARYLQRVVGAAQDGIVGPATIAAVEASVRASGEVQLIRNFQNSRREYYRQLGTFSTFGKGWLRRVDAVEQVAMEFVR